MNFFKRVLNSQLYNKNDMMMVYGARFVFSPNRSVTRQVRLGDGGEAQNKKKIRRRRDLIAKNNLFTRRRCARPTCVRF